MNSSRMENGWNYQLSTISPSGGRSSRVLETLVSLVFGSVARGDTNSRSLGRSEGGAVDARIVIVLPDRSPWHSLQSKKRDSHDHSDPSQPHRRGRIVAVNTVINTLKKGHQLPVPPR